MKDLYNTYHKQLFVFIRNRVPDSLIAEDILHDVFERAQIKLHTVNEKQKVGPWLFQIARNMIVDYYRKEKPTDMLKDELIDDDLTENQALDRLQLSVLEMTQQLPLKYRQALFFAHYKGFSNKAIALKFNITISCAKSRVQRARKMMKEIYLKCCHFEFDVNGQVIDYYPL